MRIPTSLKVVAFVAFVIATWQWPHGLLLDLGVIAVWAAYAVGRLRHS
jgi:hypothetical protein